MAAVGAGLVVAIDDASGEVQFSRLAVGSAVGTPLVAYLASLWLLYVRVLRDGSHQLVVPATIALIIGALFTPAPVLAVGLVLGGMVVTKVAVSVRGHARVDDYAVVESVRA